MYALTTTVTQLLTHPPHGASSAEVLLLGASAFTSLKLRCDAALAHAAAYAAAAAGRGEVVWVCERGVLTASADSGGMLCGVCVCGEGTCAGNGRETQPSGTPAVFSS